MFSNNRNYAAIYDAISKRKRISAMYEGHQREMCPHVIGLNKQGHEQVLSYQFGGTSSKGPITTDSPHNWRCMRIDGLSDIRVYDGPWRTYDRHTRPQTCVHQIDLEVSAL
jgi:hypothetical protein